MVNSAKAAALDNVLERPSTCAGWMKYNGEKIFSENKLSRAGDLKIVPNQAA